MKDQEVSDKFILCECRGEGMLVSHLNEDSYKEFDIAIFRDYEYSNNLWKRIKYAAWHLWTGRKHFDQLVMSYEKAEELIEFMNNRMKNNSAYQTETHHN